MGFFSPEKSEKTEKKSRINIEDQNNRRDYHSKLLRKTAKTNDHTIRTRKRQRIIRRTNTKTHIQAKTESTQERRPNTKTTITKHKRKLTADSADNKTEHYSTIAPQKRENAGKSSSTPYLRLLLCRTL